MNVIIEIPDTQLQLFANAYSLVNDATLATQAKDKLEEQIKEQMKIRFVHEAKTTAEGNIPPELNTVK